MNCSSSTDGQNDCRGTAFATLPKDCPTVVEKLNSVKVAVNEEAPAEDLADRRPAPRFLYQGGAFILFSRFSHTGVPPVDFPARRGDGNPRIIRRCPVRNVKQWVVVGLAVWGILPRLAVPPSRG